MQVCYVSLPKHKDDVQDEHEKPRKNKGFAFIEYSNIQEAKAAVVAAENGKVKLGEHNLTAMEKIAWLDKKKTFR